MMRQKSLNQRLNPFTQVNHSNDDMELVVSIKEVGVLIPLLRSIILTYVSMFMGAVQYYFVLIPLLRSIILTMK